MFLDATKGRPLIHEKQRYNPLSLEEICAAVRGRFKWDTKSKSWTVGYGPYRDYWIILLKTVNERLFALPVPKIVPSKI